MKITLKQVAYTVVFLLIVGLMFQSYRLSIKSNELNNTSAELAVVQFKLSQKQDSLNALKADAIVLQYKSDSLGTVANNLQKDKEVLYGELQDTLAYISSHPTMDSTCLSGAEYTEVRKMRVENIVIKKINVNLITTVNILRIQNSTQDSLISNQYIQLNVYEGIVKSLKTEIGIKDSDNIKLNKDVIKQKRITYLLQGIGLAEAAVILIILL